MERQPALRRPHWAQAALRAGAEVQLERKAMKRMKKKFARPQDP
jgi:hypothetical protein